MTCKLNLVISLRVAFIVLARGNRLTDIPATLWLRATSAAVELKLSCACRETFAVANVAVVTRCARSLTSLAPTLRAPLYNCPRVLYFGERVLFLVIVLGICFCEFRLISTNKQCKCSHTHRQCRPRTCYASVELGWNFLQYAQSRRP